MKYIRTKDGISKLDDDWALFCKEHTTNKQADTIEELCDLFMLEPIMKDLTPIDFKQLWRAKKTKNEIKLETTLYGAIWVKDKGLIYVAKMNEKGELELI